MKKMLLAIALLLILAVLTVSQRHRILFDWLAEGEPPALLEPAGESPGSYWQDDYFLIEQLDSRTFAIGEPLYRDQNFSYLITGSDRAVLFDAGPGYRDIRSVAEALTDLPITFIPSHFHYDHVGNRITFEHVAVADLPWLRRRATSNRLKLTWAEHLGTLEGIAAPTLDVDEWLPVGSIVDLGARQLRVLYTPGHTEDSISLLDVANGYVFSGDFIYPGPLYAFLPNSRMGDYLQGSDTVLAAARENVDILGAHRDAAPGLPRLTLKDLEDLRATLIAIRDGTAQGSGIYPREYRVNDRIQLLAEPRWLQDW
jgi:glyoxylase-like metal-dependent hydrolase (beta-lactamase superfamily II)